MMPHLAEACWEVSAREVSVRGALKLRSHQLTLHEARFNVDAETQQLGAALHQWQVAAQGTVAAAALESRVAERRLVHQVFRCVFPIAHVPVWHEGRSNDGRS